MSQEDTIEYSFYFSGGTCSTSSSLTCTHCSSHSSSVMPCTCLLSSSIFSFAHSLILLFGTHLVILLLISGKEQIVSGFKQIHPLPSTKKTDRPWHREEAAPLSEKVLSARWLYSVPPTKMAVLAHLGATAAAWRDKTSRGGGLATMRTRPRKRMKTSCT